MPGRKIARIRVESNFGESELNEGSTARVAEGSIEGHRPEELVVIY